MGSSREPRYAPVASDENGRIFARPKRFLTLKDLLCSAVAILIALACFLGGRYTATPPQSGPVSLSTSPKLFLYNRTFGEPPSELTNRLWEGLFPRQGGFFKHPQIAPQRSALSVFHQLHCLNGIREGYWAIYNLAREGKQLSGDEDQGLPMMASPPHIRHCIDLLRQSLMCQPDTTIETKNETVGGVTGFGTQHRCKDWDTLLSWTSKWEAYGQDEKTKVAAEKQHSEGSVEESHLHTP